MAKKKVTLENLGEAVDEILKEYGNDVVKNANEVTKRLSKMGSQLVKEEAKQKFNGKKYYKSWTYKIDKDKKAGDRGIIYSRMPQLPHLLEKSHKVGKNGWYEGRPHIQPVEEKLVEEYQRGIKQKI